MRSVASNEATARAEREVEQHSESSPISKSPDDLLNAFKYFGLLLRVIAPIELIWMIGGRYYLHQPQELFKLPVLGWLGSVPTELHIGIFVVYCVASMHFIVSRHNGFSALLLAACMLYFDLHDKFSFHHSIFLAANYYFLYGLGRFCLQRGNLDGLRTVVFCLKFVLTLVYLVAGLHKLVHFDTFQVLIANLVSQRVSNFGSVANNIVPAIRSAAPLMAVGAIVFELGVPVLLWFRRTRGLAVCLVTLGHVGILVGTGRGGQFNLLLPTAVVLFFSFPRVDVTWPQKYHPLVRRFDVLGLVRGTSSGRVSLHHYWQTARSVLFMHPALLAFAVIGTLHLAGVLKNTLAVLSAG